MPADYDLRFAEMVELLRKIERWWIREIEIPTNLGFDDANINPDECIPGLEIGLRLLCDIALGDEETAQFYLNEFKRTNRSQVDS